MEKSRIQAAKFESRRESEDYERKVAETVEAV
jgi:hypothetical protein